MVFASFSGLRRLPPAASKTLSRIALFSHAPPPHRRRGIAISGSLLSPDLAAILSDRTTDVPAVETTSALPPAPPEPTTLKEAGLEEGMVDSLVLKTLLHMATASGRDLARNVCLSRQVISDTLSRFRDDLLVTIKGQAEGNDYVYQLTDAGRVRARQFADLANYADAAPVPLDAYDTAIRRQTTGNTRLGIEDLRRAFGDLTLGEDLLSLVAQALTDGRGLFLYGSPGNGKTTLAELLCEAFGKYLWIPRAVCVGTDIIRLFDASCHEPVDAPELEHARYDRRWVLIKRPTVVVGGELTLEQLEPSYHAASGVSEAPVQMKANGGALVIDDFGRQRVSSTDLLNRLIVPLEKQFDYLSLPSGRQARIPFEMLFVLSTNLEPSELVDEAFLRRIPYKVEVCDPSVEQFRELFGVFGKKLNLQIAPGIVEWLLKEHYAPVNRPMRFCHPRDLLRQVKNYCAVHQLPPVANQESFSVAIKNYFAGL